MPQPALAALGAQHTPPGGAAVAERIGSAPALPQRGHSGAAAFPGRCTGFSKTLPQQGHRYSNIGMSSTSTPLPGSIRRHRGGFTADPPKFTPPPPSLSLGGEAPADGPIRRGSGPSPSTPGGQRTGQAPAAAAETSPWSAGGYLRKRRIPHTPPDAGGSPPRSVLSDRRPGTPNSAGGRPDRTCPWCPPRSSSRRAAHRPLVMWPSVM